MRPGASSSVRSTATVAIRSGAPMASANSASRCSLRPVATTPMPISESLVAQPKPIPPVAPVTIAICMSSVRLGQGRLDLVLEHLAGVISRELFPDHHLLGRFECGDPLGLQETAQARDVRTQLTGGHDDGTSALAGTNI